MHNSKTLVWDRDAIFDLLDNNDKAVARAILALYKRQTAAEQSVGNTQEHNSVGFTAFDAPFLSSLAESLPKYNNKLTIRQLAKARPMMKKYWKQLLDIAEENGATVKKAAVKVKTKKMVAMVDDNDVVDIVPVVEPEIVAEKTAEYEWGSF